MVLDLVVIALAIAVFPLSVTAFVLVLSARGGVWKGLAFLLGWLACFVAVLAVVLLGTGGKPPAPSRPRRPPRPPSSSPSARACSATGGTGTVPGATARSRAPAGARPPAA
jgi:hypothetical protein